MIKTGWIVLGFFVSVPLFASAQTDRQPAGLAEVYDQNFPVVPADAGYRHLTHDQLTAAFVSSELFSKLPWTWPLGGSWRRCYQEIFPTGSKNPTPDQKRQVGNLINAYYGMTPSPENLPGAISSVAGTEIKRRETYDGYPVPWGVTILASDSDPNLHRPVEMLSTNCLSCHGGVNRNNFPDSRFPNTNVNSEGFMKDLVLLGKASMLGHYKSKAQSVADRAVLTYLFGAAAFTEKTMLETQMQSIPAHLDLAIAAAFKTTELAGIKLFTDNRYSTEAQTAALFATAGRDGNRDKSNLRKAQLVKAMLQKKYTEAPVAVRSWALADKSNVYTVFRNEKNLINVVAGAFQFHGTGPWTGNELRILEATKGPLVYDFLNSLPEPTQAQIPTTDSEKAGQRLYQHVLHGKAALTQGNSCESCHVDGRADKYDYIGTDKNIELSAAEFAAATMKQRTDVKFDTSPGIAAPSHAGIAMRAGLLHNGSIPLAYFLPGCGTDDPDNPKYKQYQPRVWRVLGANPDPQLGANDCSALRDGTYHQAYPPKIETADDYLASPSHTDAEKQAFRGLQAEAHRRAVQAVIKGGHRYVSPYPADWYDAQIDGGSNKNIFHSQLLADLSDEQRRDLCSYLLTR